MTEVCAYLDWDSDRFGWRIARINSTRLSAALIDEVARWCQSERIDCLYLLADPDDDETARLAELHQFAFVDVRLTLTTSSATRVPDARIRTCEEADLPTLKAIARTNHRSTRFYHDPVFDPNVIDGLYETWIDRSCRGELADVTFVCVDKADPTGYITCTVLPDGRGQIGLLGVAREHRLRGNGRRLVEASIGWFHDVGVTRVDIVTQGRNIWAQRLLQRAGFATDDVANWYHWWSASIKARSAGEASW